MPKLIAAAVLVLAPAAAQAQADDRSLAGQLRECRKLADASTRTACYDRIALDERAAPRAGGGFGGNQLPRAPSVEQAGPDRISARVARAVERQPGIYRLTLEDGTEWQFVDAAPAAYDPPRAGSTIEISRASMGSYLIRYAGQRSVRARRTL